MGMTEKLPIVMTNTEPSNKHVIWLKDDMLKRWTGVGWKNISGTGGNGTTNYNELINKPKINGVVLQGDVKLDLASDIEIIDSLNSTAKDKALSANQGKILFDDLVAKDSEINNLRLAMSHKASLASTLEGYGIENAYNKLEINNMLKNITAQNTSDVYKLQVFYYTADQFEELSTALNVGKVVILNDAFLGINYSVSNDTITIISLLLDSTDTKANIEVGTFEFKKDGTYNLKSCNIPFTAEGKGTKFLSDDGTYKEITSGESYDLATQTSNGLMSKEDKIKLDGLGDASGIILTQAQYDALTSYDNVVYFIKG
jgi:hypothetical protein